jgi:hypothetical protein
MQTMLFQIRIKQIDIQLNYNHKQIQPYIQFSQHLIFKQNIIDNIYLLFRSNIFSTFQYSSIAIVFALKLIFILI